MYDVLFTKGNFLFDSFSVRSHPTPLHMMRNLKYFKCPFGLEICDSLMRLSCMWCINL